MWRRVVWQTDWDELLTVVSNKVAERLRKFPALDRQEPESAAAAARTARLRQRREQLQALLSDVQTEAALPDSSSQTISEELWRRLLEGLGVDATSKRVSRAGPFGGRGGAEQAPSDEGGPAGPQFGRQPRSGPGSPRSTPSTSPDRGSASPPSRAQRRSSNRSPATTSDRRPA